MAAVVNSQYATLAADGPKATILRSGWDNLAAPAAYLAAMDLDFEINEPGEFKTYAMELAHRLSAAAGTVTETADAEPQPQ